MVNYPSNDVRCQHVDVCVVAAGMQNGCAAIAVGSGLWAGGYGPTTLAAIQYASSRLPAVESRRAVLVIATSAVAFRADHATPPEPLTRV